jgi:hypothetical protein
MASKQAGDTLDIYLDSKVFRDMAVSTEAPKAEDIEGFNTYIKRYEAGLDIERAAVSCLK